MMLFVRLFIKHIFLTCLHHATILFTTVLRRRVCCSFISKTLIEHFNLRSNHGVFFVHFAFHHSRSKTIEGSEIFEIKAVKNHIFRSSCIFGITRYQHSDKKYFVFIILYENKISVCLSHNILKASIL